MEVVAIVLGAGSGQRIGGRHKAFLYLLGRPMFVYSIQSFALTSGVSHTVLVVPPGTVTMAESELEKHKLYDFVTVIEGGESRMESAMLGLKSAPPSDLVMIHDASRPCVTTDLVLEAIQAAKTHTPVVPALPVVDTIRRFSEDGKFTETVEREGLFNIQTPQVFRRGQLDTIYDGTSKKQVTDDASLYELLGLSIFRFEGDIENFKITFPGDIDLAEAILRSRGIESL